MRSFSSSILSDKSYGKNIPLHESTSINAYKETTEPMLYRLLEFNEANAMAELDATREYYISLINMANRESTNFDPAYNAIFNRYDSVHLACTNLINYWGKFDDSNDVKYREIYNKIKYSNIDTTITIINSVKSPPSIAYDIMLYDLRKYCTDALNAIKNDNFNSWVKETNADIEAAICRYVSKAVGIEEANNINEFVSNYQNAIKFETVDIHIKNAMSVMYDGSNAMDKSICYMSASDLFDYSMANTLVSTMKVHSDKIDINGARKVIDIVSNAVACYSIIIAKIRDIIENARKKVIQANMNAALNIIGNNVNINYMKESMEMFGDEITTQSIFADLDPEDFNPTEFMDVSIVAEHVYTMDCIEARKYAMALEARLLSEGKYDQLYVVNEALGEKIKSGVGRLIDAIKKIVARFIEAVMGNFAPEKKYLLKYKNAILNHKVDGNTPIKFNGDIINGMIRLQKNFKIPTMSYNDLVANRKPEDFESVDTLFNVIRTQFGELGDFKRDTKIEKLADDLKYFWGFKKENFEQETTFGELNMANIYNFLINTDKEASKLKVEIKNIERSYDNYEKSAKSLAANRANPKVTKDGSPVVNKEATYFSAIYEAEIGEAPAKGGTENKDTNTQQNTNNDKTNTNLTRGDTDAEVKKTSDDEATIVKYMGVYVQLCKDIISARATAFNYVHKELMSVVRYAVKKQYGNNADVDYSPEGKKDPVSDSQKKTEENQNKGPIASEK